MMMMMMMMMKQIRKLQCHDVTNIDLGFANKLQKVTTFGFNCRSIVCFQHFHNERKRQRSRRQLPTTKENSNAMAVEQDFRGIRICAHT